MDVTCHAARTLPCPAARAFALICDAGRFPSFFTGFGPIPSVRAIEVDGPLRVGTRRRVRNGDGSVLAETVTAFDPPSRHAYRLSGFRGAFATLVRHGDADWRVTDTADGAHVAWRYQFRLTHALAAPVAVPLLRVCMAGAMQRCLDAMARAAALDDAMQGRAA